MRDRHPGERQKGTNDEGEEALQYDDRNPKISKEKRMAHSNAIQLCSERVFAFWNFVVNPRAYSTADAFMDGDRCVFEIFSLR
jgi:hypothetical protein